MNCTRNFVGRDMAFLTKCVEPSVYEDKWKTGGNVARIQGWSRFWNARRKPWAAGSEDDIMK